jgi:hypothetical protein
VDCSAIFGIGICAIQISFDPRPVNKPKVDHVDYQAINPVRVPVISETMKSQQSCPGWKN